MSDWHIPQIIELADGTKCVRLDDFKKKSTELERERDEAREQANVMHEQWLSKGRCCENLAEELHEVKQQRDEALAAIVGWENKWKCAVEMAALAQNKLEAAK